MLLLNVNKVTKNFEYENILNNVSFNLNEGKVFLIVSPNGCGESILIKILADFRKVNKENISIKNAKEAYLKQVQDEQSDTTCY